MWWNMNIAFYRLESILVINLMESWETLISDSKERQDSLHFDVLGTKRNEVEISSSIWISLFLQYVSSCYL